MRHRTMEIVPGGKGEGWGGGRERERESGW